MQKEEQKYQQNGNKNEDVVISKITIMLVRSKHDNNVVPKIVIDPPIKLGVVLELLNWATKYIMEQPLGTKDIKEDKNDNPKQ